MKKIVSLLLLLLINTNFLFSSSIDELKGLGYHIDKDKKVFVLFVTEHCKFCKKEKNILLSKKVKKLLKERNYQLIFAKDVPSDISIQAYPTFYAWENEVNGSTLIGFNVGFLPKKEIIELLNDI